VVRLVLEHILVPYREKKYVFLTKDQWEKEDLPKMREKYPAIELPYLQDGEKVVCGVEAMLVYVLHKYNRQELLGKTPEERVRLATAKSIYWEAV
jgi:glutathione S-transferase